MINQNSRPLEGLRVLDLTVALSGPYGSMLLGGMGAEVIRIEAPGGSDIARGNPPFAGKDGLNFGDIAEGETSLTILNRARNKKSITLDLKSAKGHEIFMRLVRESDVLIENMSEGTTQRLKIDYEAIRHANPRLVYCSIKAFNPGTYDSLKGMDIIVQALSGVMGVTGFVDSPPTRIGVPIADLLAPMYAVNGVMAALIQRGRTGEGQMVQVSMLDCLASWVAEEHFDVLATAGYPTRSGNSHDRLAPFGVFPTKDGHVAIVAFKQDWVRCLLDAMGRLDLLDDPMFCNRVARMRNATALNVFIEEWSRGLTSTQVVSELLEKRGLPCAKVRTPDEVLHDPLLHKSGAVMNLKRPDGGDIGAVGMGLPIQFSGAHAQFDEPASELGAGNDYVYGEILNLSAAELYDLKLARVV
jgi:crotonobetainyl-CoA:carnitine CoA-transferase CaiB-like acyl-CoA transferase